MNELIAAGSKSALSRILAAIAVKLEGGRSDEIRELKRLADKKFQQIEVTHRFFLDLLGSLHIASSVALERLRGPTKVRTILGRLAGETFNAHSRRQEQSEARREQYEEARVYGNEGFQERGLLKRVPEDVVVALRSFMVEYCNYFVTEHAYSHELANAIEQTSNALDHFRQRLPLFKKEDANARADFERLLREFMSGYEDSREKLRTSWANVSEKYHRLNKAFREHGLNEPQKAVDDFSWKHSSPAPRRKK